MFHDNDRKTAALHLYRSICCALLTVMVAGNVLAEDDPIEIDPNGFTVVLDVLRRLWNHLAGLFVG